MLDCYVSSPIPANLSILLLNRMRLADQSSYYFTCIAYTAICCLLQVKAMVQGRDRRVNLGYQLALECRKRIGIYPPKNKNSKYNPLPKALQEGGGQSTDNTAVDGGGGSMDNANQSGTVTASA